jgi:hypothetical protein
MSKPGAHNRPSICLSSYEATRRFPPKSILHEYNKSLTNYGLASMSPDFIDTQTRGTLLYEYVIPGIYLVFPIYSWWHAVS